MKKIKNIPKLAPRPADGHKGDFGKVCIIAGSVGMAGAAAIAGRAALRAGAGLVRVAAPMSVLPIVAAIEPCYTTIPLPEDSRGCISTLAAKTILDIANQNDVTAFGPGVGTATGPRQITNTLISQRNLRLVIDADGLNCLAKDTGWVERKKTSVILTPHLGEMKRLWAKLLRDPLPSDRAQQAVKMAKRSNCTVVLKGAATVVADRSKIYVNTTGNPGMATAGSGDVLTGVITAMAGQGLDDFDAAVLGGYIHGLAGDIAVKKTGQISLIATDIIEALGAAFMEC